MGNFSDTIRRFGKESTARAQTVHNVAADLVFESIVHGSPITGAPGQPVAPGDAPDAGKLRDSWKKRRTSATETVISTDVAYAEDVELNLRGVNFSNHGPYSVALTEAGFPAIVQQAVRQVGGGAA